MAVTTTTHIYNPCVQYGIRESWSGDEAEPVAVVRGVAYFGRPQGMDGQPEDTQQRWKLGPVSPDAFRQICSRYDVVYVEADGSHSMPAKIPLEGEPVLPPGADEVVIVMGRHAVGRPPRAVCQHYDADRLKVAARSADGSPASDRGTTAGGGTASDRRVAAESNPVSDGSEASVRDIAADSLKVAGGITAPEDQEPQTPLTEAQLRHLAEACYIRPLRIRYPWIRSTYYLSDMYRLGEKEHVTEVTFILMASGFGRRYSGSENKLLADFHGRPLYLHALEHLAKSAQQLRSYQVHVRTGVVTRYPEIMQQTADMQDPDITRRVSPLPFGSGRGRPSLIMRSWLCFLRRICPTWMPDRSPALSATASAPANHTAAWRSEMRQSGPSPPPCREPSGWIRGRQQTGCWHFMATAAQCG